jgi:hypothetical protein
VDWLIEIPSRALDLFWVIPNYLIPNPGVIWTEKGWGEKGSSWDVDLMNCLVNRTSQSLDKALKLG